MQRGARRAPHALLRARFRLARGPAHALAAAARGHGARAEPVAQQAAHAVARRHRVAVANDARGRAVVDVDRVGREQRVVLGEVNQRRVKSGLALERRPGRTFDQAPPQVEPSVRREDVDALAAVQPLLLGVSRAVLAALAPMLARSGL